MLISPFTHRRTVAHAIYDHTSVLKLIEWRWGLEPLSVRDAAAANLAGALDFSAPNLDAPRYAVPTIVPVPCPVETTVGESEWTEIAALARSYGFPV